MSHGKNTGWYINMYCKRLYNVYVLYIHYCINNMYQLLPPKHPEAHYVR